VSYASLKELARKETLKWMYAKFGNFQQVENETEI
jgi:hypothetical protein